MYKDVSKSRVIFDPIYGFIKLTSLEWEIINTAFYQRLRWIKQLGFSCYVFPGAEHSRFGHSIGVLNNAQKILESCGMALNEKDLFDETYRGKDKDFHQSLRLGALMHDLGTFPFSHTTEGAYIKFGETINSKGGKNLKDDHENLGSFIIKNTDYPGGVTFILKKYGVDPQRISDLVKGVSPSILANQILHSDIDCDRMDYLLRDAHYTGLKYGSYDRDYLLYHFRVGEIDGHKILTLKENALHCIEDFLMSRFSWYSQVVRSPRGARYDAIAERLTQYLLKKGEIYKYSDLLEMILNDSVQFYSFNDHYFMSTVHKNFQAGNFSKNPDIEDMAQTLLFQSGARYLNGEAFAQKLISQDDSDEKQRAYKKAKSKLGEINSFLSKNAEARDWIIDDLPTKDIKFVQSRKNIVRSSSLQNVLLERDPVKISDDRGRIKLLTDVENSIISKLDNTINFIPNVYVSESAYQLLLSAGIIQE